MAVADMRKVLSETAALLDAVIYGDERAQPLIRAGPHRYLFVTDPPDLRLWRPGDDINIVCLSDNRAQTFWAFVAEKKDDELFAAQTLRWTHKPRVADEFDGLSFKTLPEGGNLHLQYAPLPTHFDIALVEAYNLPDYPEDSSASTHARHRLKTVQQALDNQHAVSDAVVQGYHGIRDWAENAGLFSKDFGPLDPERLLRLVLKLKDSESLEQAFFTTYSDVARLAEADLGNGRLCHVLNNESIAIAAARTVADWSLYSADVAQYASLFRKDFKTYIQLRCRCWSENIQAPILPHLIKVTKSLQQALIIEGIDNPRVWPMPLEDDQISTHLADERTLILLLGIDEGAGLAKWLETYTCEHWNELERDTDLTEITIESQRAVQDYRLVDLSAAPTRHDKRIASCSEVSTATAAEPANSKLRTAGQTLSRLRWDPAHRAQHYEVGYLDRFDGLKWMLLEDWGRAVEEEDFIPEHRIQQYRRVDDGQIVWDRSRKIDLTSLS
ncbi:hypothetical protein AMS68_005008 [Peltaster fructicola]|uniref:MJ1316 RNA cyclic group end recognition domain-containing protein n=1 Tax=Peltaster fructicola TaxID=286661 RepID=A0A6H0XXU9_9PEZI|nr:hypothetical protein AMS68_005008 [Peltaster fructicola]